MYDSTSHGKWIETRITSVRGDSGVGIQGKSGTISLKKIRKLQVPSASESAAVCVTATASAPAATPVISDVGPGGASTRDRGVCDEAWVDRARAVLKPGETVMDVLEKYLLLFDKPTLKRMLCEKFPVSQSNAFQAHPSRGSVKGSIHPSP